ncbi:MAG: hypothetical protein M0Z88_04090 [Actinomycetota bacterium]|nr:hypothetical protein [Actinomycetota bacterium]
MNLAPLGPFTPVLGQKIAVIPGGQYAGPAQLGQVRLVNLSGFSCSVSSSSEGDLPDLAPFTTMVYDAPARGGSLSLTPVSGSAVVPAPQITGQLYVDGGTFPGTYPQTLPVTVVDIAAGATVDLTGPVTVQGVAGGTPVQVAITVDVNAPPSSVVIAPSRVTTVQRNYARNFVGAVDLINAPQPAAVQVVQSGVGISADASTVSITLPQQPTVGNLLVLVWAMGGSGGATPPVLSSRWSTDPSSINNLGASSTPVEAGDSASFDLTLWSPALYNFAAILYEISGADLTSPFAGMAFSNGSTGVAQTLSMGTGLANELAVSAAMFGFSSGGGPAFSSAWTSTIAGIAAPVVNDGIVQAVGWQSFDDYLSFAHGPSIGAASQSLEMTDTIQTSGSVTLAFADLMTVLIAAGASAPTQAQVRVWELDLLGSSTDQPYITRNDTGEILLATTGAISRSVSFQPGGLLLPPGTGVVGTSVDSANFGAVWSLA